VTQVQIRKLPNNTTAAYRWVTEVEITGKQQVFREYGKGFSYYHRLQTYYLKFLSIVALLLENRREVKANYIMKQRWPFIGLISIKTQSQPL